ncbi:MAG TPA: T9SS type A sorting domain-containing protein, partial [candidate division WOR-3 bacterium]|nr:T9SS type A sorting domain-containing protein [candidate division WOR-3 bacterium]
AFNNGQGRPDGSYSSVEEIVLPRDSLGRFYIHPDSAFGPEEPAWTYSDPGRFYSPSYSGAFRMPNGNTLITEGTPGLIFEVTPGGEIVWAHSVGGQIGRVQKYPRDFLTFVAEPGPAPAPVFDPEPSIARDNLSLPETEMSSDRFSMTLFDASGRKVMEISPGENDIRHLTRGVYFVRTNGSSRKIVIQ